MERNGQVTLNISYVKTDYGKVESIHGAAITIQHVCGYDYSDDFYRENAKKLESYGFICCRSNRGSEGRFWEIWFLPGLWMAEGDL